MLPANEQVKHFDQYGNNWVAWSLAADSLLAAGRLLKSHRDTFDPARLKVGDTVPDEGKVLFPGLMLMGFAVECLLKAMWVKQGNTLATDGRYLGVKGAADHDLVQLADAAGLQFTREESDVMKRLSIIMTSSGRYPIPRKWEARRIQKLRGGGKGPPEYWATPSDDRILDGVIGTIENVL